MDKPDLAVLTLPCRTDNYAYLLHDADSGATALVDAPEAGPVLRAVQARGWRLDEIWLTHHHGDHIDGVADLVAATGARVTGARADAHRLPALDRAVAAGEGFAFAGRDVQVMDAAGHTVGHVAFHLAGQRVLFTGDSLMAGGCGRLFEGTPAQMWDTLCRFAVLDPATLICSGHEYTASNLAFAAGLELVSAARAAGRATVPSVLAEELATNPFLRAGMPQMRQAVGLPDAPDDAVFAAIRARKDRS